MRSMMEFDSPIVSEYLVGHGLVGLEMRFRAPLAGNPIETTGSVQ